MDGVCMVGYHSRAQGLGILAHTINSFAFAGIEINGQAVGEAGLYGALAGEYGAPVLMASGDDVFIAENRPLFPHATFVQTKRATGQTSGVSLSPAQACAAIRIGVESALAARDGGAAVRHAEAAGGHAAHPDARAGRPVLPVARIRARGRDRAALRRALGRGCGAHAQLLLGDVGNAALSAPLSLQPGDWNFAEVGMEIGRPYVVLCPS